MSLVDGSNLSTWEGGLFDRDNPDSVSLLYRTLWLFTECRALGVGIELNEAGRPYGVPGDRAIGRAGLSSIWTASGRSTVYYQKGREDAGLTPSAADPAAGPLASRHTMGTAEDVWSNDYATVYRLARRVGLAPTIKSEKWHLDTIGDPDADIDFSRFTPIVDAVFGREPAISAESPEQREEREIMGAQDAILQSIAGLRAEMQTLTSEGGPLWQLTGTALNRSIAPTMRGLTAFRVKGTQGQWVIDIDAGYQRHLSGEDRARLVKAGLLADREQELETQADLDFLKSLAAERLAELRSAQIPQS